MDSRKAILMLGLLAMVLLISSEVSARDLTETSSDAKKGELYIIFLHIYIYIYILELL